MFRAPFSFEGRIRRLEYGISFLIYLIFIIFINIVIDDDEDSIYNLLGLGAVPLLWFLWAQGAKRCHDLGSNGWYQIVPFYFLVLIFRQGEEGENYYGDDPRVPKGEPTYIRPEVIVNQDESNNEI
ncbi:MAG: DUF805 domain-containing protein [Pseudosphingobacterium sp.]|nr:DUF805 domain-containing protein [Pseudosphingobacterium sp.]